MKYFFAIFMALTTLTACSSTPKSDSRMDEQTMCNDDLSLPGEVKPHRNPFTSPSPHIESRDLRNK